MVSTRSWVDMIYSLLNGYLMQSNRRSYSQSFKAQVIQKCAQPRASIASATPIRSLKANLVHKFT